MWRRVGLAVVALAVVISASGGTVQAATVTKTAAQRPVHQQAAVSKPAKRGPPWAPYYHDPKPYYVYANWCFDGVHRVKERFWRYGKKADAMARYDGLVARAKGGELLHQIEYMNANDPHEYDPGAGRTYEGDCPATP